LLVTCAAVCASQFLKAVDAGLGDDDRFKLIVDQIPEIRSHHGRVFMILGSSLAEEGFSPNHFDDRLLTKYDQKVTSYNIACWGITPNLLRLLAKRLRNEYESSTEKPEAIFIDFTPNEATKRLSVASEAPLWDAERAVPLIDLDELAGQAIRSPSAAAHTLALWAMRGRPPGGATPKVKDWLFGPDKPPIEVESERPRFEELLRKRARIDALDVANWEPSTRGGRPLPVLSVDEQNVLLEIRRMRHGPKILARHLKFDVDHWDYVDLDFDDHMIEQLIETIGELRKLTPKVILVVFPRNPLMMASEIGRKRLDEVLRYIKERTGVPIWDYFSTPDFADSAFSDYVHLDDEATVKFSTMLADRYEAENAAR
jgi:hypothetical protein